MIENAVQKEISKRLVEIPAEKRSKIVKADKGLSLEAIHDMPWAEIHRRAKARGA